MNFEDFLKDNNFLPLDNGVWKKLTIDHTSLDTKKVLLQIEVNLQGYKKGIYVYTNQQGKVYYVGQGKLKARVKKKYIQATNQSNDIPSPRGLFFRSKKEELNVYVIKVEDYMEQIALEAMLSIVLKPEYLDFLREFNNQKKEGKLEEFFGGLVL
jgi:hypothetical protein